MLQQGYDTVRDRTPSFVVRRANRCPIELLPRNLNHLQHKNGVFKVPEIERWHVIVTKPELVEEVRKAPDDALSFEYAVDEVREGSQDKLPPR